MKSSCRKILKKREGTNTYPYSHVEEVLQVMLDWLMEYTAQNWRNYSCKVWTTGRVALATPHGAKYAVFYSSSIVYRPIVWSRISKECWCISECVCTTLDA